MIQFVKRLPPKKNPTTGFKPSGRTVSYSLLTPHSLSTSKAVAKSHSVPIMPVLSPGNGGNIPFGDPFFMASQILYPARAKEFATHCHSEYRGGYLVSETGEGERSPMVAMPRRNSFIF